MLVVTLKCAEIVGFLNEERLDASDLDVFQNVEPSLFVGTDWSQYLNQMGQLRQFGDHITLWAAAQKYDIQIAVVSSWCLNSLNVLYGSI